MVQLQAKPYKNESDDYLALGSSFGMMMVFLCSIIYKYAELTNSEDIQDKMSIEQRGNYMVSALVLTLVMVASVMGSLVFAGVIVCVQIVVEVRAKASLRRLKYMHNNKWVECDELDDAQAFHLFLSHAWPAAQDRMRIVKARFKEALPSARVFLDVRPCPTNPCRSALHFVTSAGPTSLSF